jgi:uncharacterized protein (TIGR02996 family)
VFDILGGVIEFAIEVVGGAVGEAIEKRKWRTASARLQAVPERRYDAVPEPRRGKDKVRRPPRFVLKASTNTERELVTRLGTDPTDEAARMVYGDWLESHGMLAKASFVRGYDCLDDVREVIRATDAAWRATTSCQPIVCSSIDCPRRWSGLAPVDGEPWLRRCRVCTRTTRFCTDLGDLRARRGQGEQVLLDLATAIAK